MKIFPKETGFFPIFGKAAANAAHAATLFVDIHPPCVFPLRMDYLQNPAHIPGMRVPRITQMDGPKVNS